jgi:iron complex outermembrane receptor protein
VRTFGSDDRDAWSHEINISSTGDGPFQWLFGAYYYQEQYTQNFHIAFPNEPLFDTVYPISVNPLALLIGLNTLPGLSGLPDATKQAIFYGTTWAVANGFVPPTGVPNPTRDGYGTLAQLDTRSAAVFAQFDYDFTEQLHATFGVRYTHDEKEGLERQRIPAWYPFFIPAGTPVFLDLNGDFVNDLPFAATPAGTVVNYVADIDPHVLPGGLEDGIKEDSWNHTTGTLGLQWTPSDDTLVYASYSYGYKSGGFTLGPFKPGVDPETIDAIELGWKQSIGDTLQVNAAIYHYNYHGLQTIIQTPVTGGATAQLINLNETRTKGAELEAIWVPSSQFTLMANYSYSDAEILAACCFLDDADPFAGVQDLAGARVPFSPEHKAAINATYRIPFEPGELSFSLTENYRSSSYYTVFNTSNWFMEGYDTTDLRVRWQDSDDRYSIIGTVANAFDEEAVQSFSTTNPQTSSQQSIGLQPPRIVSVELQLRF